MNSLHKVTMHDALKEQIALKEGIFFIGLIDQYSAPEAIDSIQGKSKTTDSSI